MSSGNGLPSVTGKVGDPGRSGRNHRLFVEAILWINHTGTPWRDLPSALGRWNSVYPRFRRWSHKGLFGQLLRESSSEATVSEVQMEGTHVRVH